MVQPLVVKFAGLIIKTLTKPVANQIKSSAVNPGLIRAACLQYGRLHHKIESRAALRMAGHDAKNIKPLNEESAVALGANVFSEVFIFTVAAAILMWEINKKAQDDDAAKVKKDAQTSKEKNDLEARFLQIEQQLTATQQQLKEAQSQLLAFTSQKAKKGWL